jgi:hypothetical protein
LTSGVSVPTLKELNLVRRFGKGANPRFLEKEVHVPTMQKNGNNKHDSPAHGNTVLSVTTLSGTNTGHFDTSELLQAVVDWIIEKQNLIINGPMTLSLGQRPLSLSETIEQAGVPKHAKLTYLADISGGGRTLFKA